MRSFVKFLVESPTKRSQLVLPAMALLSIVLFAKSINVFSLPGDSSPLYVEPSPLPEALAVADGAGFRTLNDLMGDKPSIWLKSEIEQRLNAVAERQPPDRLLSDGGDPALSTRLANNPDYRRWLATYFCTARGWDGDEDRIRRLIWEGVGPCSPIQWISAGVPAMRWFGFAWGALYVLGISAITLVLVWFTATFNRVRKAYRWLYRSRVF